MKKVILVTVSLLFSWNLYSQIQMEDIKMGLYELQFPSANGGNNRIKSYGGSFPGKWLFKSRFDDIHINAGENNNNRYRILFLTGDSEVARFNPNGYFGLGTSNPNAKLEISGAAVAALGDNSATASMVFSGTNNWKGMVWTDQSGNGRKALRYNQQDGYLGFSDLTSGGHYNDRLVLKDNGYIGIGTTSPFTKFDVVDIKNSDEHLMTIRNNTVSNNSSSGIALINSTFNGSISGARLTSKRRTSGIDVDFNIQIYDGSVMNQRLTVLGTNGNVGIGTTNPDSKLTVKGAIHSQEVICDVDAGTGPDYVFEEDYNLISLEETKAYIETNKHLPEVPSARVMESEGLELRDMSLLLLKKIEEMTLHQIELMEEVKALKAKVKELEK